MKQHDTRNQETVITTLPLVDIPVIPSATPDEIERRRLVVERILRRRERIGPIGIRADDLLHEAERDE